MVAMCAASSIGAILFFVGATVGPHPLVFGIVPGVLCLVGVIAWDSVKPLEASSPMRTRTARAARKSFELLAGVAALPAGGGIIVVLIVGFTAGGTASLDEPVLTRPPPYFLNQGGEKTPVSRWLLVLDGLAGACAGAGLAVFGAGSLGTRLIDGKRPARPRRSRVNPGS